MPTPFACLLSVALLFALPAEASVLPSQDWSRNLVSNPSFEDGEARPEDWTTVFPPAIANSKPRFTLTEVDPKEGKLVGQVRADYPGGFTSYSQEIKLKKGVRSLRLEGWARLDQVTFEGHASMLLDFHVPGAKDGGILVETARLTGRADWTRLVVDAAVPEGAKKIVLRCGVVGPSVASFDDVVLRSSKTKSVTAGVFQVTSDFAVRLPPNAEGAVSEPFLRVGALPLSPGQTVAAVRVNTTPAGMVRGFTFSDVGPNREIEIALQAVDPGDRIKVRVERIVMAVDGDPVDESRVIRLPRAAKLPEDVAGFLGASAGIDPESDVYEGLSEQVRGTDFPSVVRSVLECVGASAAPAAEGPSIPVDSLGLARAAAALLRVR